ncbi:MAG: DUF4321 domain-containing protein [Hyphomonadaceae bacterium]|nr:DUF4321 domain-containing protein [Clostridia bacterium]
MPLKKISNAWLFLIFICIGVVLGGALGSLFGNTPYLGFLTYGKQFGINPATPFVLDLQVLKLSVGFVLDISISSIIGVVIAIVVYKRFL